MPYDPRLRRLTTPPLLLAAFLLVVFEETIWRLAKRIGALLARLPLFAMLERVVIRLPPRWVVAVFLLPIGLLIPVKLGALWLIAHGHVISGVGAIVLAKLVGTAFSARLYHIAEPRLMLVPLFVRLHGWAHRLLARAHAALDAWPAWQTARTATRQWKLRAKLWLARRRGHGGLAGRFAAARLRWRRMARRA